VIANYDLILYPNSSLKSHSGGCIMLGKHLFIYWMKVIMNLSIVDVKCCVYLLLFSSYMILKSICESSFFSCFS
jgi:hypothetical protein